MSVAARTHASGIQVAATGSSSGKTILSSGVEWYPFVLADSAARAWSGLSPIIGLLMVGSARIPQLSSRVKVAWSSPVRCVRVSAEPPKPVFTPVRSFHQHHINTLTKQPWVPIPYTVAPRARLVSRATSLSLTLNNVPRSMLVEAPCLKKQ